MTLTELRYLVVLAEQRRFSRTATLCHVSQPTLSIAIRKLEEELGVALFERTQGGVHATPIGLQMVDRARQVLQQVQEMRELADSGKDPLIGPLALGTLPTIGPYLLPQCIPLLRSLAGGLSLSLQEGETADLAVRLRQAQLDVLILALPLTEADVVVQPLFDEPFMALVPAKHPLAAQECLSPGDLQLEDVLLLSEEQCFARQVLEAFPNLRRKPESTARPAVRAGTLEALRTMVASGLGVTVVPASAAYSPAYPSDLVLVKPFADPVPYRTLALAWRASFPRHQAVDALRQALLAATGGRWRYRDQNEPNNVNPYVDNHYW